MTQGVNRLFVLSLEDRLEHIKYYLPAVEIKYSNVMTNGKNIFNQSLKIDLQTYDNIRKIVIGQGDDCTTCCLLYYDYFKDYYKMTATDLSN